MRPFSMQELQKIIESYENHIKLHGITDEVIDKYSKASHYALVDIKDVKQGLQISARAKQLIEQNVMDIMGKNMTDLETFCRQNDVNSIALDNWYNILKLEAPYLFHSYLLYLEKNREESERFYSPKMEQLNKHGLIQAMQDMEDDKYDRVCLSMPPGTQKCQPLYSKVLTPNGFIEMRDVEAGTKVISGTGNVSTVLSVSPIKKRAIYEITLDDGSKVRCSDNHLWRVQTRDDRRRKNKDGSEKYRTIELSEMLKNYKIENGRRCNYSIDYVSKIDMPYKDFIIHPYVMGVILGDGGLTQGGVVITSKDIEVIDKLNELLPKDYQMKHKDRYDYRINGHEGNNAKAGSLITKELKKYGLYGKKSIDKFIPKDYLYASYEQRLWLLRGLMDTDGSASNSYCVYATISEMLANDVCELVHSLGGYASKNKRKAGYRKNGEYIRCNDYYELIIQFNTDNKDVFCLERKNIKYNPKRANIKRFITNIEYIGEEDCKCIYIDDESHLYITDNYIITHNTTLEKFFASWIIGKYPKDYSLFFSHNNDITEKFYKGELDITTDPEYTWSEIFPDVKLQSTNAKAQEINFGKYKPYASIQCSSIGSNNAGKVRANRYLYCDDLIGGIEDALNPRTLDKIWNIYGVDLKQRKLNQQVKELIVMTRWSTQDVIGHIIELYGDSDRTKIIAVPDIDPQTGKSNFDYKYNGMTVEHFNDMALTMDEVSYKCLYKQEPIEREGLLFPDNKVRRYKELPTTPIKRITGQADCKGKGTDYFVLPCLVEFEGYEGDFYCIDALCNKSADYEYQYERAANLIVDNEMQDCEFESNQGGDRVAMEVGKRVEEKGWICNITDVPTESNKEARIFQCSNWILQHIIFKDRTMYSTKEDYGVMMSELLRYSVSGKNPNDDVPDVFSNFSLKIKEKDRAKKARVIKSPL